MTTTIGGLSNNGAIPKTVGQVTGVLAPTNPSGIGTSAQTTPTVQNNSTSLGTNPGLIGTASTNTHTVTINPTTGATTTKPASSPSVLAQQQWLNSQGAGLVEDGIAGPLTAAAIAKYGTQSSPISQTKAPNDPSNQYNTATGQPNPNWVGNTTSASATNAQTTASTVNSTTGKNANGSTTSGAYTPPNQGTTGISQGGLIGNAVAQSQAPSAAYTNAVSNYQNVNSQLEALKAQEAQQTSDINQSGTWTSRANGEQGQANIQNASTEAALSGQLNADAAVIGQANTQQGLEQSALGTAIGANAPITGVPYGTQTITPSAVSPTGSSSQYGTGPEAAANVSSIQNYTTQLNNLQAAAPAADAAFSVLNSYAQGINASTPIASGLAQLYGSTAQGSAAVAGFKAQLQAVRNAWDTIEGGGSASAIPDNVTPQQLTQVQQQLKTDVQNKTTGYQQELSFLNGSSGSTGNTSGANPWK